MHLITSSQALENLFVSYSRQFLSTTEKMKWNNTKHNSSIRNEIASHEKSSYYWNMHAAWQGHEKTHVKEITDAHMHPWLFWIIQCICSQAHLSCELPNTAISLAHIKMEIMIHNVTSLCVAFFVCYPETVQCRPECRCSPPCCNYNLLLGHPTHISNSAQSLQVAFAACL